MTSPILERLGPPTTRGVCYSCDALKDLAVAESVAAKVGSAAAWYSVGILSPDEELSRRFGEFCRRHDLRPLLHAIDLDVCGTDPLDEDLLAALVRRADELDPPWVNIDLAMWCRGGETLLESLVPMPLVDEAVAWTAQRVKRAQDALGRPVAIENAPYPFLIGDGDILQLMNRIAEEADCLLTIDFGHLYGLRQHQGRPFIQPGDDDIRWDRVVECHMSGTFLRHYPDGRTVVDDKHDWPVAPYVWDLAMELLPRATNLRALMAEAEGLSDDDLAASVLKFSEAFERLVR